MPKDALIGQMLGSYKIEEAIGAGGMARIYRGVHTELNRYGAVKVVNWGLEEDPEFTQRFRREAQAIAGLRHPNIVQIFDFGKYDNGYFMVMEFIDGQDLSILLHHQKEQQTLLPKEQIIRIIKDIAAALDHAHDRGVIHRDVKPSNIMLNRNGQAILTDFGLVMLSASKSQATLGGTFGTPHYVAPEQAISSAAAVAASDTYSLGVILYEMVTNQLLFDDESPLSIALKHVSDLPTPPTILNPDLPRAVEEVVLTSLAKEPADRYATVMEMALALERAWLGVSSNEDRPYLPGPILPVGVPLAADVPNITLPKAVALNPIPTLGDSPQETSEDDKRKLFPMWLLSLLGLGLILGGGGAFLFFANSGSETTTPTPTTVVIALSTTPPPSRTATPVPSSRTPTLKPNLLPEPTLTPTPSPSPSPALSPTPPPTRTATPSPTLTPPGTATPVPTPTPPPTVSANGVLTLDQLRGKILFKTDRLGSVEIYQMDGDGSNQLPLASKNWSLYTEVEAKLPLSSTGQEQIVIRGEGQLDLWRSSLVDGRELRVTSTQSPEYDAAWSPVDNRIVYVSEETGRGDIYLLNLDGSAVVRLTDNVDDFDKHPTWSPDGTKVAFWSNMGFNKTRQIWAIDLNTRVLTSLSDNPFNDWDPVWVH